MKNKKINKSSYRKDTIVKTNGSCVTLQEFNANYNSADNKWKYLNTLCRLSGGTYEGSVLQHWALWKDDARSENNYHVMRVKPPEKQGPFNKPNSCYKQHQADPKKHNWLKIHQRQKLTKIAVKSGEEWEPTIEQLKTTRRLLVTKLKRNKEPTNHIDDFATIGQYREWAKTMRNQKHFDRITAKEREQVYNAWNMKIDELTGADSASDEECSDDDTTAPSAPFSSSSSSSSSPYPPSSSSSSPYPHSSSSSLFLSSSSSSSPPPLLAGSEPISDNIRRTASPLEILSHTASGLGVFTSSHASSASDTGSQPSKGMPASSGPTIAGGEFN